MSKTTIAQLEKRLALFPDKDTKNLKIETAEELGTNKAYHITLGKFKALTPNISRRALPDECNTIPHSCVALDLFSCIRGYATTDELLMDNIAGAKADDSDHIYKGGLLIYSHEFDIIVSPNKKLVPGVLDTDEKWLISYNDDTITFPVTLVGKLIPLSVEIIPELKKEHTVVITFIVNVTKDDIKLNTDSTLVKGCYYKFKYTKNAEIDDAITELKEINEEEYEADTRLKICNLSYNDILEKIPAYVNWI